jgi:hypothetical protein
LKCPSIAALIPLEELKDTAIRQRYDIPADAEVFDMLETVAREKEVRCCRLPLPHICVIVLRSFFSQADLMLFILYAPSISCAWC